MKNHGIIEIVSCIAVNVSRKNHESDRCCKIRNGNKIQREERGIEKKIYSEPK